MPDFELTELVDFVNDLIELLRTDETVWNRTYDLFVDVPGVDWAVGARQINTVFVVGELLDLEHGLLCKLLPRLLEVFTGCVRVPVLTTMGHLSF